MKVLIISHRRGGAMHHAFTTDYKADEAYQKASMAMYDFLMTGEPAGVEIALEDGLSTIRINEVVQITLDESAG